jgi:putative addiction module killer protein
MFEIRRTQEFSDFLDRLRDERALTRITARIDRFETGNPGLTRALGGGISELKIDYGPGYRVYYCRRGKAVILLLCAGDKSSQKRDIALARTLAQQM